MTKEEFVNEIIGTQYVNRGYDFDGCDCYGLVYLYYKHVIESELLITDEYKSYEDFVISFTAQIQEWEEVENPNIDDCAFVSFGGSKPIHCGVYIGANQFLHSCGDPETNRGQVVIWKMRMINKYIKRYYQLDQEPVIKYYRPKVNKCQG